MIVYKIKNIENGKCYIGQTIRKLTHRKSHHIHYLKNNEHRNSYLQNAWNKYGEESFEFEILEECNSIEELNKRERYWVKKLNSMYDNNGYNLEKGGRNTTVIGKNIHQYNLDGNYIQSFNSISEASRQTGTNRTSILDKRCNTAGGFQWSLKKKEKLPKIKEYDIGGSSKKPVIKLDKNNNKINEFESIISASRSVNVGRTAISECLSGRNKTADGYKWKYKEV